MSTKVPTVQTVAAVAAFSVVYMRYLVRKTLRERLDLYDLFLLSLIALIPAVFTFFPSTAEVAAEIAGVAFPFVIMFSILLAVAFILVHRLAIRIHRLERQNRSLIQELALLNQQVMWEQNNDSASEP